MEPSLTPNRGALKINKRMPATLELVEIPSTEGIKKVPVLFCDGLPHVLMPIVNMGSKRMQAVPLESSDPLYLALVAPKKKATDDSAFEDA